MTARSPDAALARRLRALAAALAAGEVPDALRRELAADVERWEALLANGAADTARKREDPAGRTHAQLTLGADEGAGAMDAAAGAERNAQGDSARSAGQHGAGEAGRPAPAAEAGRAHGVDIRIWGDGSCAPNPGPGGWGAIIDWGDRREELSGGAPQSTNNIMELSAMIQSLRHTAPGSRVHMSTDSQYVKHGITQWLHAWKRKGWRKADGQPVLNQDLWRALDGLCAERKVSWEWVRGHSGPPEHERCDELANDARCALASGR